jgi:hypothetical protein
VPKVRPLYYGFLAWSEFAANYSTIVNATVLASDVDNVRAYGAVDGLTGAVRTLVLHRDYNATEPLEVTVTVQGGGPTLPPVASLVRLWAPQEGVLAKNGVTWGGQTFDGTQTGLPVGVRQEEPVPIDASGNSYTFFLYPASAAMLVT